MQTKVIMPSTPARLMKMASRMWIRSLTNIDTLRMHVVAAKICGFGIASR